MKHPKIIFIDWSAYSSRTDSLARKTSAKPFYLGKNVRNKSAIFSLLSYLPKSVKNIELVFQHRPNVIIIKNTQWIIALVNIILGKIIRAKVVFDSHSCAFDHPFMKYPLFLSKFFARHAFLSIVTNNFHEKLLESVKARAIVITDIPSEEEMASLRRLNLSNKFNICYICTFSNDEPYLEVFNAARKLENIQIYVTGNYRKAKIDISRYINVQFMDFLPNQEYKALLNSVDAIITLTTREYTMQRGGSEAISVRKPLITSDTKMLRTYFKRGTVFAKPDEQNIKEAIENLKRRYEFYLDEVSKFSVERRSNFKSKLEELRKELGVK